MASRGINKVILIGNLGQDPEVRHLPSGGAVANVSLATSETWKDKQTGATQDRTEWHRVVFYNRLAEIVGEYLKKGSKLYIEGSLRTRKWQDKTTGADRYTTEIIANEMQMLDSKGQGGGFMSETPMPEMEEMMGSSAPAPRSSGQANRVEATVDFDDDIPF